METGKGDRLSLITVLCVFGLCQITEIIMKYFFHAGILNTGFWWIPFPSVLSLVLSIGALYFIWTFSRGITVPLIFPSNLILGGISSNVIDRILYTGVIDYWGYKCFAFNLSDIFIISGMILLFIRYKDKKED